MRHMAIILLLILISFLSSNCIAQDSLTIKLEGVAHSFECNGDHLDRFRYDLQPDGIKFIIELDTTTKEIEWLVSWKLLGESYDDLRDRGIIETEPATGRLIIKDTLKFKLMGKLPLITTVRTFHDTTQIMTKDTLKLLYKEKRDYRKTFGYSILPGGGRFKAGKAWQGAGIAALQLLPIYFAINYNNQRHDYYNLAKVAAARGDRHALDENFDKCQDYRLYAGIAIGITAAATLFNIFDVLINVKDFKYEPLVTPNGVRLNISKNF